MISISMSIAPFIVRSPFPGPRISVSVMDSPAQIPVAGSTYSLNCTVTGVERLNGSNITYQWFKNGTAVSDQTVETLSFTPLSSSDAGRYTCQATVMSSLLSGPIPTSSSNPFVVNLTCKSLECS